MHPGVIERVRKAKEEGDFLYVGIWDDETVRYYRGDKYPLVNMQERLLMALSCRYIDDVVIGAPFVMTEDLIKSLNIDKVVNVISRDDETLECYHEVDPFEAAKTMQVYTEIEQDDQELTVLKIA
jgi:ethanolamine-phosphate cytidylyltransferase